MLRALLTGDRIRIDQAITLDGKLLAPIAPTYQVLRRTDGALLASGPLLQGAGPGLFSAVATIPSEPADNLRVTATFSYLGLEIDEESAVLDIASQIASVSLLDEIVGVAVTTSAVAVVTSEPTIDAQLLDAPIGVSDLSPVVVVAA